MNSKILLLSSACCTLLFLIACFFIPATSFAQGYHRKQDYETASTSGPSNRDKPYKTYDNGNNSRKDNNRKYQNGDDDRGASDRGRGHDKKRHDNRHQHHYQYDDTYRPGAAYSRRAPHWHYTDLPRRGTVVDYCPSRAQVIKYGAVPYYYYEGVFYKLQNRKYVVVRAPFGMRVGAVPFGCHAFYHHGKQYYYYYGTYYVQRGNYYETVSAPVGSLVESIPDGYEKLIVNGETYYIVDGVQYKAVLYDGEIWYEVIKVDC